MIDYREERNKLLDSLENEYIRSIEEDDKDSLNEIINKMVSYKFIVDTDDEHLKSLKKSIGLKNIKFTRDFRAGVEYNSAWVLGNNEDIVCSLTCNEHIGKRIEGCYEGEVTVDRRDMELSISEIRKFPVIKRIRNRIKSIELANNYKHMNIPDTFEEAVRIGKYIVYEIKTSKGNFLKNEFGYIIVNKSSNYSTINIMLCIDKQAFEICSVNIDKAIKKISKAVKTSFEKLNQGCEVQILELK